MKHFCNCYFCMIKCFYQEHWKVFSGPVDRQTSRPENIANNDKNYYLNETQLSPRCWEVTSIWGRSLNLSTCDGWINSGILEHYLCPSAQRGTRLSARDLCSNKQGLIVSNDKAHTSVPDAIVKSGLINQTAAWQGDMCVMIGKICDERLE